MTLDGGKRAEIESRTPEFMDGESPAPRGWLGRVPAGGVEGVKPFGWQLIRLAATNAWVAPGARNWLAARLRA